MSLAAACQFASVSKLRNDLQWLRILTEVRRLFSESVLGKTIREVDSYWQGQVFSGKASPPPILGSDQAVVDFVRRTTGAVGYVSSSANTEGVRVLTISG
jgi:hypothetical protein